MILKVDSINDRQQIDNHLYDALIGEGDEK